MNTQDDKAIPSQGNYGALGKEFQEFVLSDKSAAQIHVNPSAHKTRAAAMDDVSQLEGLADSPNLDVILDIPVTVSMEVGNAEMSIRDLLKLNQGSVVELDRLAGDALDVLVNGTLIAHGEVVVVDDKFGIRLTDIVSPSERISRLR